MGTQLWREVWWKQKLPTYHSEKLQSHHPEKLRYNHRTQLSPDNAEATTKLWREQKLHDSEELPHDHRQKLPSNHQEIPHNNPTKEVSTTSSPTKEVWRTQEVWEVDQGNAK